MRKLLVIPLAIVLLAAGCATAAPPAPTPAPTPVPPATAKKLIVYGDTVWFSDQKNPDNCVAKSRFKHGDAVGFRMTAIDPLTGKVDDAAELVVKLSDGTTVPMRYRGTGTNPHPGMWTGKWVVPDNAATGVVKYTVEAKDKDGRTGTYEPFNVESSMLTVVSS